MIDVAVTAKPRRILDFDIETVAAGFADPAWVPQRITVIAWSWVGSREIKHSTRLEGPTEMFGRFLTDLEEADIVAGHNILRFDLRVLNADLIRTKVFGPLGPLDVIDTMRLPKTLGLKKGQDNLARLLGVRSKKMPLDWQAWDDGYEWDALIAGERPNWSVPIERCRGDVRQHKQLLRRMQEETLVRRVVRWEP